MRGRAAEAEAEAADLGRADRAQKAGCGQGLASHVLETHCRDRQWRHQGQRSLYRFFERWSNTRGFWGHAYLAKDTEAAWTYGYGGNLS